MNCWEYKKCGREPGGIKVHEFGICPASVETRINGTHGGKNGGRACWVVAGSVCGGKVQVTFAEKCVDCMRCDFYISVKKDEGKDFILSSTLLEKLSKEDACLEENK